MGREAEIEWREVERGQRVGGRREGRKVGRSVRRREGRGMDGIKE